MNYSAETVPKLLSRFGSPLYVFDEKGFVDNYSELNTAMRTRYENYRIAYSFKTNYTPYVCALVKRLGAYAEVVSGMEYALAKRIGFADEKIIFNGPSKGPEGLEALRRGALVNVDSLDELTLYCEEALAHPDNSFRLGLRVNLDIGQNFISRFGLDEKEVASAFEKAAAIPNLNIVGLHCHISRCRSAQAWKKRTEILLDLADRYFPEEAPEYLDLGSGMYGSMAPEFAAQFDDVPSYEEYAEVTAGLVAERYRGDGPLLFTEPGTTLVNRFVNCLATVESIKCVRDHYFAVLDCSIHNLGETCTLKRLPVTVIPGGQQQRDYSQIDLTGYTCLEQDILYPGYTGKLAVGDTVVFGNTGGYSNVLKPPFIRPNCVMAAETMEGDFLKIKEAETYQDIFHTYLFEDGQ